jgi:ADP-heptose:LPS heptosyltransferase
VRNDPIGGRLRPGAPLSARVARLCLAALDGGVRLVEQLLFPLVPAAPRRVGVWRVGMIGDTLAALPALAAVRASHPDAQLVLFTSPGPQSAPGARELLRAASGLGDLELVRWSHEEIASSGARGLVARLRAARVDRLYVLPQDRSTPLAEVKHLAALFAAGMRGVRGSGLASAECLPKKLRNAHDRWSLPTPEAERLLALATRCGARATGAAIEIFGPREAARARELLARLAPHGEALLCLGPGAKLAHKRWSPTAFGRVARAWTDAGGVVATLGAPHEHDLALAVERAAGVPVANLAGRLDLVESAALLAHASAVLSNDTGTMHLAASVGAPLVAVFAGTDREGAWHPWRRPGGGEVRVLRHATACAPCRAADCAVRVDGEPACLAGVASDAALAAVLAVARVHPGAEFARAA